MQTLIFSFIALILGSNTIFINNDTETNTFFSINSQFRDTYIEATLNDNDYLSNIEIKGDISFTLDSNILDGNTTNFFNSTFYLDDFVFSPSIADTLLFNTMKSELDTISITKYGTPRFSLLAINNISIDIAYVNIEALNIGLTMQVYFQYTFEIYNNNQMKYYLFTSENYDLLFVTDNYNQYTNIKFFELLRNYSVRNKSLSYLVLNNSQLYEDLSKYSNEKGYEIGYADGNRDGYESGEKYGYEIGYSDGNRDGYNKKYDFLSIIKGAFDAVSNFFNMEIFPGVKFIYIVGIPIVIAVLRFVIGWFR